MKLSTKGRYAVMAMSDLAVQARLDAKRPVSLAEIGAREGISRLIWNNCSRACAVPVW